VNREFSFDKISVILFVAITSAACAPLGGFGSSLAGSESMSFASGTGQTIDQYGSSDAIERAIGVVKLHGTESRVSSRAIRLPENPLGEVTIFSLELPSNCGGHAFRVIEADGIRILEFEYTQSAGDTHQIRDYVAGPSPFVQPGLWTAYDHTADSISSMKSLFSNSGGRHASMYSQSLVTSLPATKRQTLGKAYQLAISDVRSCRDI
jgi:hypothetical protein